MKVSIIIPVYKVELYIKRCILSVLNQIYQDIEIILVDDCSPDKSIQIAQDVINHHPNKNKVVFVSHQYNRGLSAARNTGIDIAKGDYLYFLDSDDELPLDAIEALVNTAIEYGQPDFIYGHLIATGTKQTYPLIIKESILTGNMILEKHFLNQWYVMGCNKMLKKSFVKENNLYFIEGILHEDITWSFNLAMAAKKMGICHKSTYIYHIRENSITKIIEERNVKDLLFSLEYIIQKLKNTTILYNNSNALYYIMTIKMYILGITVYQNFKVWKDRYYMLRELDVENIPASKVLFDRKSNLVVKIKYILLYHTHPLLVSQLIKIKRLF